MSESTLTFRINVDGANEAAQSFQSVGDAAKQMGSDVNSAGSEMGGINGDFRSVGTAAKSAATDSKSFGAAIADVGTNIASAAAGIVGFVRSIENVSRATDKAEAAQTKLIQASNNVEKAQDKLAQAIAKFGPASEQAAQAAAKLDLALRKEADAASRAENATENVGFAMSAAATGAIQFAASMANIAQVVQSIQGNLGTLKNGINGLVSAFSGVEGGISGAVSALGSFKAGAAAAVLAAGALVLVLNEVGKATGDLNNQKTVFGTDVVIQFEDAKRAVDGFNKTMRDLISNIPGIGPAIASVNKSLEDMINKFFGVDKAGEKAGDGAKSAGRGADDAAQSATSAAQAADDYATSLDKVGREADQTAQKLQNLKRDFLSSQKQLQQKQPGGQVEFGTQFTHGLTKGGQVLPVKTLVEAGVQFKVGPEAEAQLERDFKKITGEKRVPVEGDLVKWDEKKAQLDRDIAAIEQANPSIDILADGTVVDTVTREVQGKIEQLPDGSTIYIKGDARDAEKAAGEATTSVTAVPDDHITLFNAETGKFEFDTEKAATAVDTVPTNWDTTFAGQATNLLGAAATGKTKVELVPKAWDTTFAGKAADVIGAAASGERAIKLVPSVWDSVMSGDATDVNSKANQAQNSVMSVDEKHMTGFEAIANAFKPVTDGVNFAIDSVKEAVVTTFTGQDVNAKSTAGGITAAAKPLDATFTSRFSGQDVGASGVATGVLNVAKPLEGTFTSRFTGQDQGASTTAGNVKGAVTQVPTGKNTAFDADQSLFIQGWNSVMSALGIGPPDQTNTNLKAVDHASNVIQPVKAQLDALDGRTVTVTIQTKAGPVPAKATFKRHGGSVIAMPLWGRRGVTDVVTSPTNVRVGEGFKPEVVTVTPLTGTHAPAGAAATSMAPLSDEARALQKKEERANKRLGVEKSKQAKETAKESATFHAAEGGIFGFGLDQLFGGGGGGNTSSTAEVSLTLEDDEAFKQDTEEIAKIFADDKIPKEWTTKLIADTGSYDAQVSSVGKTLDQSVPEEKTTEIEASDKGASSVIRGVTSQLDRLPTQKTITINIRSTADEGARNVGFRHGGTSIISHPTNIRVGEGFHPELVSVIPLGKVPHAAEGGQFISLGPLPEQEPPPPQQRMKISDQEVEQTQATMDREHEQLVATWDTWKPNMSYEQAGQYDRAVVAAANEYLGTYPPAFAEMQQQEATYLQAGDELKGVSQGLDDVAKQADKTAKNTEKAANNAAGAVEEIPPALMEIGHTVAATQSSYDWHRNWLREFKAMVAEYERSEGLTEGTLLPIVESAKGFGPMVVRNPTMFLAGEAGPEMVEVTPLARGTRGGGGGDGGNMARVEALLEKLVRKGGGGMEANLVVDGQRMASVSEKYVGVKSYGDR